MQRRLNTEDEMEIVTQMHKERLKQHLNIIVFNFTKAMQLAEYPVDASYQQAELAVRDSSIKSEAGRDLPPIQSRCNRARRSFLSSF